MPTCLYLRGAPGTGKRTVADLLERDLKWPVLWVHLFDPIFKCIGDYRVPMLTDELMNTVSRHFMKQGKNFIVVRPSRDWISVDEVRREAENKWVEAEYTFIPVRLTASYRNLCTLSVTVMSWFASATTYSGWENAMRQN